jgi:prepilin-type N-terminal cleavage/methylation domain-containing protein
MKKGFTLVELLAVIVILAIILLIAVPNIVSIINKSRIDVYKKNEGILINFARMYLTQNGVTLQDNEKLIITYNQLTENKIIEAIRDIRNNNECDKSVVIAEKSGQNVVYTPGLVCDNYLSIDAFDQLGGLGKFEKDTDNNGLADGFISYLSINHGLENGVQQFTSNPNGIYFRKLHFVDNIVISDKYYISIHAKSSFSTVRLTLEGATGGSVYHSGSNKFEMLSGIFTPTNDSGAIVLYDSVAGRITQTKLWVCINLTKIYGEGNEPTKTQMDQIIINSL